jgi:ribosome-associated toxin RatA of RatAB toxin-antitoxin module
MAPAKQWTAIALAWGLACALPTPAADFTLTKAEMAKVAAGQLVIRATLDASQRRGTVRAALQIAAPAEVVFRTMTSCADALEYVPHLRSCRVRERGPNDSWMVVEHEIDFGWYAPRMKWVSRADMSTNRKITFHQVSGDFRANEGTWELEPSVDGSHTLLLYRIYLDPPGYVPNWLARSTFKRELPQMLTGLRRRCETEQGLRAQASPH